MIQYPKLDPEKWANAKLTVKERGEIDEYINKHGYSIQRVADMYKINFKTVRYWSDPVFRASDIARANANMARRMENPEYRKKSAERRALRMKQRLESEPMFKAWYKQYCGRSYNHRSTPEQRAKYNEAMKTYYKEHKEIAKA